MKKTLFTFLCICITLLIVSCGKTPQSPQDNNEETNGGYEEAYSDVISQYTNLLTAKHNGEELPKPNTDGMDEREAKIAEAIHGIVSAHKTTKDMGYGYKDLDGNGIPELMLMNKAAYFYAIFTLSDDKPILLEAVSDSISISTLTPNNRFFIREYTETDNIQEAIIHLCRVDGDKMAYDSVYGAVYAKGKEKREIIEYFQIVDDEKILIDDETYKDLNCENEQSLEVGYYTAKLLAPRIHLPLADNNSNNDLPVADFSDYTAIKETYKAIADCIDDFKIQKWIAGDYDNLFAFSSDTDFDYYNKLIYATHHGNYNVGYDEIDLNGDGQDELVIMNEDYSIKAIFTKRNGTPVMLDSFGFETCWLDDQGLIHVDNREYYEIEYSLYEFTKDGDYNHLYSVFLAKYGNRYLIKNGKYELITPEKSMEIYADYFCYPEQFDSHEHTRTTTDLTYTPLYETTEDLVKAAVDKTWSKYSDMEKTTGKLMAYSYTYVTFGNATDTQMDVNFKYDFCFGYYDPNDDHKILPDQTESFLKVTASAENGVFVFNESGIKGRIEFGNKFLWIIFEESTDQRFPKGAYCFSEYSDKK